MITEQEIQSAEKFFKNNDESILKAHAIKVNTHQPLFAAIFRAMEMHGVDGYKVDDLFESIFVIHYVYTILRKKNIAEISAGQLENNIRSFGSVIEFYKKEKKRNGDVDISKIKFISDETILWYALKVLLKSFGTVDSVPTEVLFPYFALLKAIESGAAKGK